MKEKFKEHQHILMIAGSMMFGVIAYTLYKLFFPEIDFQNLLNDFANLLGNWTYLLAGILSFAETGAFVGLLVPGETILIISGAVAGQGVINLYLLIAIAWAAGVAGDSVSYLLGKKLGNSFLMKHGPRFGLSHDKLDKVIIYFDKHGGKTILIGRFIGMIRAFAPFIAGSSKMEYKRFLPFSILGVGLQVSTAIILGYVFSKNIGKAMHYVEQFGLFFGIIVGVLLALWISSKYLREKENRHNLRLWIASKRWLSWSLYYYDSAKPGIKFVLSRFQPGERFGLELTTLAATFAVSIFIVIAYIKNFSNDPELVTFGDQIASDVANYIHSALITDIAHIINWFGSRQALMIVVLVASLIFIWRHSLALLSVLLLSAFTIEFGSDVINQFILRPESSGFPNHDAALSIVYIWLAVVFVTRLRPKTLHSGLVILSAILSVVLIGLSGVYLGQNFLSDSNAGWAYGVAIFSLFSALFIAFDELFEEMRLARKK